jgi:hypothetical protein
MWCNLFQRKQSTLGAIGKNILNAQTKFLSRFCCFTPPWGGGGKPP